MSAYQNIQSLVGVAFSSACTFIILFIGKAECTAADAITPKILELSPTFECIGAKLEFEGDDNANAKAAIQYRVIGEEPWHTGHPFVRTHFKGKAQPYFLATSILFLKEGTAYEVKATVEDADGVSAQLSSSLVTTRSSNFPLGTGKNYYVDPKADSDGEGTEEKPFHTLAKALNTGMPGDTVHFLPGFYYLHETVKSPVSGNEKAWLHFLAEPGAIITDADPQVSGPSKVKWEKYKQDPDGRWVYKAGLKKVSRIAVRKTPGDPSSGYFLWAFIEGAKKHGPYRGEHLEDLIGDIPRLNQFGSYHQGPDAVYMVPPVGIDPATADFQITIGDPGEILWQGHHVVFDGFTFELTAGMRVDQRNVGGSHYTFRNLKGYGRMSGGLWLGEYGLLEDSEFVFNSHWDWLTSPAAREGPWTEKLRASGQPGDKGWAKIKDSYNDTHVVRCLSHSVVRYNRIRGHSNAVPVNHWSMGLPDHGNFDVYGNLIAFTGDDCIEPDGAGFNIRVFNNKCITFLHGFSDAPVDAGPVFVLRNVFYGFIQGAIKVRNASAGQQLFYHNTCYPYVGPELSPAYHSKDGGSCFAPDAEGVRNMRTRNNIFIANEEPFAIRSKKNNETLNYDYDCLWALENKAFNRFIGESHAVKAMPTFMDLEKTDLRLASDAQPCVDAGEIIKGINADVPEPYQYKGKGPDLGAYEFGTEPPHYGPRRK